MLKVRRGRDRVMPGVLGLLPFTVYAAAAAAGAEAQREEAAPPALRRLDELSLYDAAPPPSAGCGAQDCVGPPEQEDPGQLEQEDPGQLEHSVAAVRKLAEPYTSWCQDTYGKVQPKVQSVLQCGTDSYEYLKNPPKDFYPRAGVIGFTGFLGLFLARGSRLKKLIYPAALMTLSASLYYPERAAAIAKSTGDSLYEGAVQGYAVVEKMLKKIRGSDGKP